MRPFVLAMTLTSLICVSCTSRTDKETSADLGKTSAQTKPAPACPEPYSGEARRPFLTLILDDTRAVIACGWSHNEDEHRRVTASGFEILTHGFADTKRLFQVQGLDHYRIFVQNGAMILDELVWLPLQKNPSGQPVPISRRTLSCTGNDCQLSPPECTLKSVSARFPDAVNQVRDLRKRLAKKDMLNDDSLPRQLLVQTLSGDKQAEVLLKSLKKDFLMEGPMMDEVDSTLSILSRARELACIR